MMQQQQQQYQQQQNEYYAARQKLLNRREAKQIELTDGHLVLEVPVPRSILQYNAYKGEDLSLESGKMRYTAVSESRFAEFGRGRWGREARS